MTKGLLYFSVFFITHMLIAQVGIGTTTPDDGSILQIDSNSKAFVPPRMTAAEMNAVPTPLNGAVVYNTTDDALFLKTSDGWLDLTISPNPAVILNKSYGTGNNALQTKSNNSYTDLPIGASAITYIKDSFFEVVGNGKIKVKKTGVYLLSVGISVSNMPLGNTKYVIGLYLNGSLRGYPTRGVTELPKEDYWGSTGTLVFLANANDTFGFQYVLNNETDTTLDAKFINIGIMKL